ncbi:MAG: glycosyltransferase family 10 domain-containing protein [Bacteroides nordii]
MKTIKVKFVDFWDTFDPRHNFIADIISKKYRIEFSDTPDYLIFSVFGYENIDYHNCTKIFYSGENITPDFNICDYAIGFNFLSFGDRYIRMPFYTAYGVRQLAAPKVIVPEVVLNRKFCSFVVSNAKGAPERERFFQLLSEYKQVDSGGRYKNNVGGPVPDKNDFIKNYKFNIAFENSMCDGYTTEKIMEPMLVNSVPIYWGNKLIDRDFNPASFVNVSSYSSLEEAVEHIVRLDQNDDEYLSLLSAPWFNEENYLNWEEQLIAFFDNIFEKPLSESRYIPTHGYIQTYQYRLHRMMRDKLFRRRINPLKWFSSK